MPKPEKVEEVIEQNVYFKALSIIETAGRDKVETHVSWLQDLTPSLNHSRV